MLPLHGIYCTFKKKKIYNEQKSLISQYQKEGFGLVWLTDASCLFFFCLFVFIHLAAPCLSWRHVGSGFLTRD